MKKTIAIFALMVCMGFVTNTYSQSNVYTTSGAEVIFSWGELEYTDAFKTAYPQAEIVRHPVRFTLFFHFQENIHLDINNNIGFYTGIGMRNVGMISDERLPERYTSADPGYFDAKIIRRSYTLGVPIALKLGSFKDNLNIYIGAEIEWAFHMKEKWWNSHSRSGTKSKRTEWWPSNINSFLPSGFIGLQLPGGANVKFRYYNEDFLNHSYSKDNAINRSDVIADLSKYKNSGMFYLSLSYQIRNSKIKSTIIKE